MTAATTLLGSGQAWALTSFNGSNALTSWSPYDYQPFEFDGGLGASVGCIADISLFRNDPGNIDLFNVRWFDPSYSFLGNVGGGLYYSTISGDPEPLPWEPTGETFDINDVALCAGVPVSEISNFQTIGVADNSLLAGDFFGISFEHAGYLYRVGVTDNGVENSRISIDSNSPTVTLSSTTTALTGTDQFTVTATFSEDVTGLEEADVIVANGSVVPGSLSGGPAVYTFLVEPTGNGDVTIFVPENVAQDLAGNLNIASDVLVIGNRIVEITQEQIAGFMLGRANNLASNQPGLIRFLDGSGCGNFNANATAAAGSISGCVSQDNFWAEVTSSWGSGNSYTLGTLGAHATINPNLIVGGMLQLDHAKDDTNNASGTGWMVGPYFAARLAEQPLFFEGRLLYGESSNSITPLGTYTDSFSTERWLAQLKVQGEIVTERVTWSPSLALMHTTDSQRAYTDSLGNTIPGQSIGLTQINSGIDFRMPIDVATGNLQLSGGLAAIYSATHGGNADFEGGRGRINMGLDWNSGNGSTIRFGTFYDGIGSKHESYGANLGLDIRF